ncbi:hypothetical protein SAMN05216388_101793 [Halorientalis persicus]|uniref:Phage protein D n=1 Tax=Halorientalis persicus TaxID=1367881 RepID=A0A1H8S017_9EURY|nr:hypothetical protein [Halorientalis persicus]SEO71794.1 hypothetical protein SAMN05216388_101793 [Halorientalis persicus]
MPVQELSATVTVGNASFAPVELTVRTNRYSEAAEVEASGPTGGDVLPDAPASIEINGERVFTGTADTVRQSGYGSVDVVAYDAIDRLHKTDIKADFQQASWTDIAREAAERSDVPFTARHVGGSGGSGGGGNDTDLVFDEIADDSIDNLQQAKEDLQAAASDSQTTSQQSTTSASVNGEDAIALLTRAATNANAIWFVDTGGTLQWITYPGQSAAQIPPSTTLHELQYVLDASAGKRAPPYQRVVVTGSSPSSQSTDGDKPGGQGASHMLTREPVRAVAGSGEPTYHYADRDIRTDQQAQQAATKILGEFQSQQAGGWIDIVGDPTIRPLDIVQLPDHLGGERYLVSGVTHELAPDIGYETRIECGGLIDDGPVQLTGR